MSFKSFLDRLDQASRGWRRLGLLQHLALLSAALAACQGSPSIVAENTPGPARVAPAELPVAAVIDLGVEDALARDAEGFSLPERVGPRLASWSEGPSSTLFFDLRADARDYLLTFLAEPYHRLGRVSVDVALNKRSLGETALTPGWDAYALPVSGELLSAGRNELGLRYSRTARPSDLDPQSNDVREISVRFDQVEVQPITTRVQLAFSNESSFALAALGEGWARDPGDRGKGVWTVGQRARVTFHLAKADVPAYRLTLSARSLRGVPERAVAVVLNGAPLGPLAFKEKKATQGLEIPSERLNAKNELELQFEQLHAPATLDPQSTDTRLLGLRVFELDVAPQ